MALPGSALIGRDAELAVLAELLADTAAGRGATVLVEGEAGIGKTALLEAGLANAQALGCQVLRGACDELTRRFPLSALLSALGAHEDSADPRRAAAARALSSPGNAEGLGARLAAGDPVMAAVEQLVGLVDRLCADGPVILLVEDLHWADEASLVLWHRLSRAAAQLPLLLAASAVTNSDRVGRAYWFLARNFLQQGSDEALDVATDALADDRVSALWRARVTALRSTILTMQGRKADARQEAERAQAQGEQLSDAHAIGQALHTRALLSMYEDDFAAACDLADHALEAIGGEPDLTDLRLLVGANRIAWLADQDRFAEAERGARQVLALAELSWTSRFGSIRVRVAEMAYLQGRWDEAHTELEQAAELRAGAQATAVRHAYQALIAAHRDDGPAAAGHFKTLAESADLAAWVGSSRPVVMARVLEADRAGSAERVIELLAPHLNTSDEHAMVGWELLLPDAARAALQLGREDTLRTLHELLRVPQPKARTGDRRSGILWCEGLLTGDPELVLSAAVYFRDTRRLPWLGKALEDAAVLRAAAGDLTSARETLAEALEVYAELGAVWDTRRALSRIRPYGVRPGVRGARRRPKTGWQALTGTETRVATLVARGLSNPDIAGQLQLSRRTVETHVSHILTKLQLSSRREVAEYERSATT